MSRFHVEYLIHPYITFNNGFNDANHTKDIIFKIIDSLMKYMDKQALLEVKLAFLLYIYCIDL